jgi:hypothetical protein
LTCLILQPDKDSFWSKWCLCDIAEMRVEAEDLVVGEGRGERRKGNDRREQ